jgi:hypothetical protein
LSTLPACPASEGVLRLAAAWPLELLHLPDEPAMTVNAPGVLAIGSTPVFCFNLTGIPGIILG